MSQPHLAILDDYQGVALTMADWSLVQSRVQINVFRDTILDEVQLVQRLHPYAIICTMRERTKFTASLLEKLPNLKLITTTGNQNRSIDVSAASKRGIPVTGTGLRGSHATVEHIWALILATTRYIVIEDANIKSAKPEWQSVVPAGLGGKTLSLLGLGRLGTQIAQIAKLFQMRVIAWSPNLTKERADAVGVELASSKEELFKQADLLSIHIVLSPTTHHLVTAADFALMKPTAFFFNTSRGPIVDDAALIQVLSANKLAGVGLDVYDIEPLPLDHPLRGFSNVTLSPHNAYVSEDAYKVWWDVTVQNVSNFLDGKEPIPEFVIKA